jgi:hypothetical protein
MDEYAGAWRHAGTGMMCFYVSDLDVLKPPGRIPLAEKMTWGDEDYALLKVRVFNLKWKLSAMGTVLRLSETVTVTKRTCCWGARVVAQY